MKVGDLVRSPLWGVAGNRGIAVNKRTIHKYDSHLTPAYEFFVLWMDGGTSWSPAYDLEVINESR